MGGEEQMAIAILAMLVCMLLSIAIHWLVLRFLWRTARPRLHRTPGNGIGLMLLGCMLAHYLEIAIFGLGMYASATVGGDLGPDSSFRPEKLELWFHSAAFYTSLGAERPPTAGLRVFAASEALTGLTLITWTASFLFLLMQASWGAEAKGQQTTVDSKP
jgi:hypothetical protein